MNRIMLSEVTPQRLMHAMFYRIRSLYDDIAWRVDQSRAKSSKLSLTRLKNAHKGETCFIIANGPSINRVNMRLLKNKFTLGMNRAYLMEEKWGFLPTYLVCINDLVLSQFSADFANVKTQKILSWRNRECLRDAQDITYINCATSISDGFSDDLTKSVYTGGTVTYACLQIAYHMGFENIYILGLDHSFKEKGRPNKTETRTSETDLNHFHPQYFPAGVKWQLPDLRRSEIAYEIARKRFEREGRSVVDLTVGGNCEAFQKTPITDVLGENALIREESTVR